MVAIFGLSVFSTALASPHLPGTNPENLQFGKGNRENFSEETNQQVVLAALDSFADFSQAEVNSEEVLSQLQQNFLVGYNNFLIGEYTSSSGSVVFAKTQSKNSSTAPQIINYIVQGGDTVWEISAKFGVTVNTIKWTNNLSDIDYLKPGQKLIILPTSGVLHTVKKGDTLAKIASFYKADLQRITEYNQIQGGLKVGKKLIIPGGQPPPPPQPKTKTKIASSSSRIFSGPQIGWLIRPTTGVRSRGVGWGHAGVDICNKIGTPVWAAASGTVTHTGWYYGYGLTVMIKHSNGVITLYAHLSSINVSRGQYVRQGQVIGRMGTTGRTTGSHLHFEVRGAYNPF